MNLNLERVIRFCIVAEEMSFTRAAKRLNVDQAWLSRQIQQLEDQLGFRLFERTTRKINLTPEGEAFLENAEELAAIVEKVRESARSLHDKRHDELRVGVSQSSYWMPEREALFKNFRSKYSRFNLTMRTYFTPKMIFLLEVHKLDVAITTPFTENPNVEYIPIHRSVPGLLIPAEHPLAGAPEIRMSDVEGFALGVPTDRENPLSFRNQYECFIRAGMRPRVVPEGRLAIVHYAAQERIMMLGFKDENMGINGLGLVYRDVVDTTALLELGVARVVGDERAGVRRFWTTARQLNSALPPRIS